jgi:hypothetical protein
MATPEYPDATHEIARLSQVLLHTGALSGIPYGNTILTTSQPRFADGSDPDMIIIPEAQTAYWPGLSPVSGKEFVTIVGKTPGGPQTDAELAQEATDIRNALLNASVGAAALDRIPAGLKACWERVRATGEPLLLAESTCALLGLPMALIQTSRIVRSSAAPEDSRIMHMWYPATIVSPRPVLAKVRKVVKQIIQNETI